MRSLLVPFDFCSSHRPLIGFSALSLEEKGGKKNRNVAEKSQQTKKTRRAQEENASKRSREKLRGEEDYMPLQGMGQRSGSTICIHERAVPPQKRGRP
jgi:hypothetical protein